MNETVAVKSVVICDTEPIAVEGLRCLLGTCPDLRVIAGETSLSDGMDLVLRHMPDVVVIDKAFGIHATMDWLARIRRDELPTRAIVWTSNLGEVEAVRLMQAGALGLVTKSATLEQLLECTRSVASGRCWVQPGLVRTISGRPSLTGRELQVLELVEQGMRNKEIAGVLGIQAGTVKIHLKHIFEKTGIRGRHGLALSGLRDRVYPSLPTM
jgi:DNA-binding NarL/FixJ family response regulator